MDRRRHKHYRSAAVLTCAAPSVLLSYKVPEFRVSMSIETDKFDALYKRLKPHGVTMTALLAKAVAAALARHPVLFAGRQQGTEQQQQHTGWTVLLAASGTCKVFRMNSLVS